MTTHIVEVNGTRVLAVRNDDGSSTVEHNGRTFILPAGFSEVVYGSDGHIKQATRAAGTLADTASRLGMRVSPPEPRPAPVKTATPKSRAVRPEDIDEMIGNDSARVQLVLATRAAMTRREHGEPDSMPPHVLLTGPKGTGKTTLAKIMASLMGGELIEVISSAVKDVTVLGRTLAELTDNSVFVIDEIHALPDAAQELLYTAMEDGVISIRTGEGRRDAGTARVQLARFVLVGATTIQGLLNGPMLDRFGLIVHTELSTDAQLSEIIAQVARKTGLKLDDDAAAVLAGRSKGTPRVALNLLGKARDYAVGMAGTPDVPITVDDVRQALDLAQLDALGLDRDERAVLASVCRHATTRGMSVDNIAAAAGLERATVFSIEPLLIRLKLMVRTPHGRRPTRAGFAHMDVTPPADATVIE
jgi:Holliday junction DNA helicase RuvB